MKKDLDKFVLKKMAELSDSWEAGGPIYVSEQEEYFQLLRDHGGRLIKRAIALEGIAHDTVNIEQDPTTAHYNIGHSDACKHFWQIATKAMK